jgi:hypothetical protein
VLRDYFFGVAVAAVDCEAVAEVADGAAAVAGAVDGVAVGSVVDETVAVVSVVAFVAGACVEAVSTATGSGVAGCSVVL